jgi:hypothetical protein
VQLTHSIISSAKDEIQEVTEQNQAAFACGNPAGSSASLKMGDDSDDESLRPGDVIMYRDPIFGASDNRFMHEGTIISTDPDRVYPLELDKIVKLPDYSYVKCIKKRNSAGDLIDHNGIEQSIEDFKMDKRELPPTEADNLRHRITTIVKKQFENTKKELPELARKHMLDRHHAES